PLDSLIRLSERSAACAGPTRTKTAAACHHRTIAPSILRRARASGSVVSILRLNRVESVYKGRRAPRVLFNRFQQFSVTLEDRDLVRLADTLEDRDLLRP